MFSDRTLRQLKVSKERFFCDGGGLYVRVTPAGKKTFVYRNQRGKGSWTVLGYYPTMSLLEARIKASDASQRGYVARTASEAYLEYYPVLRRAYASHEEIDRRFQSDILPRLGEKRVDQVSRVDCAELLQVIVERGSRVAANRTLPDLKNFFAWCVERGWIQENPAALITRKSVGGRERSRRRALSFLEIPRVITIFRTLHYNTDKRTRLALGLIMCTGQRPSEILGYNDNERQGIWWTIPEERTKNGLAQKVYLSPQAMALIRLAMRAFGPQPFKGMNHRVLDKAVSRFDFEPPFTPHDLRRTMSTRLADLGAAPHVVEKMLNHKLEGVLAVYNVAEYLPERRAAWRLWGRHLSKLRRESNEKSIASSASVGVRDAGVQTND